MKLSLNWLKDYINPKLSTENLAERLAMSGLEVEAVESVRGDIVLDIEVTPNRGDLLSILGLAREVGAILAKPVKYPEIKNHKAAPLKNFIHVENKKDCSRYIATLIRDVHITQTPQGIKQRLASLGIHAINNAVDITNYVLMETGQPLHAFDYDKLSGGKIAVRRAKAGESIVTLDGIERKLDPRILVIADAQKPVAIAGIIGGQDTQITPDTKNILLESAQFDMSLIRRASRSLGIKSDSSYRFERHVNFEGVLTGANRATDLLLQLTDGHLAGRREVCSRAKSAAAKIKLRISDIENLLGMAITSLEVKARLSRLGFKIKAKAGILTVSAPVDRADIQQDVDVIEEAARLVGFDRIPSRLPVIKSANISVDQRPREVKNKIRQVLTAGGVDEIITLSMINSKDLLKSSMAGMPAVRIFNPLAQDQELMRSVMLPSFLQVVVTNFNRGQKNLRFFEIGKTYFENKEKESLGILLTGRRSQDWRLSKKEGVDIFDLKGLLERIFQSIGIGPAYEMTKNSAFDPACAAAVGVDGKQIGVLGRVDLKVLNEWDIKHQDIYFAGLYLDEILSKMGKAIKYQPISEFPAIVRDVSVAVKKEVPYKRIEEICLQQGGDVLRSVQFIEQYLGDKIQSGHKGLVFSCQYQSHSRTLREDEVSAVHERILQALIHDLNAVRR